MFPQIPDLTPQLLSTLLGYASIGCWVIAQAPQIVENYFQQSCDGLALPFLLNWLCGDITNVIGCLLTDQKEFQTLLATYFCLVDILLAGQYAYYTRLTARKHQRERHHLAASTSHTGLDYGTATGNGSGFITSGPSTPILSAAPGDIDRSPLLRASRHSIHSAELDVARAAERIERKRSQSSRRKLDRVGETWSSEQNPFPTQPPPSSTTWNGGTESTQSSVLLSANERESFRGRPRGREATDDPEQGMMQAGRSVSTSPQARMKPLPGTASAPATIKRTTSSSGQRPRAAGVVFMSVFLLVGVGRTGWRRTEKEERGVGRGEVVVPPVMGDEWRAGMSKDFTTEQQYVSRAVERAENHQSGSDSPTYVVLPEPPNPQASIADEPPNHNRSEKGDRPPNGGNHYQRIVGRASAWICTTLYLTSRLPQIWKNYTRKSVEGLSILLFVFAFMGNATYVGSIVLNPGGEGDGGAGGGTEEERAYFLLEALPYLLGSGGTLIFDLTIMCQAMYYGSAKPVEPPSIHHEHHHHSHPHQHHHQRSRSHSSFRPGPGTNTVNAARTRNRSVSRSFTSLDPVDEESQLLLKDDADSITGYRGPIGGSSELPGEPDRSSGVVVDVLGRRSEEGSGEMTPTPTGAHRDR